MAGHGVVREAFRWDLEMPPPFLYRTISTAIGVLTEFGVFVADNMQEETVEVVNWRSVFVANICLLVGQGFG